MTIKHLNRRLLRHSLRAHQTNPKMNLMILVVLSLGLYLDVDSVIVGGYGRQAFDVYKSQRQPTPPEELQNETDIGQPFSIEMVNGKMSANTGEKLAIWMNTTSDQSLTNDMESERFLADMDAYDKFLEALEGGDEIKINDTAKKAQHYMSTMGITMETARKEVMNSKLGRAGNKDPSRKGKRRERRYLTDLSDYYKWDKCIIPYKWKAGYTLSEQRAVLSVMRLYELYTGVRFVPYNDSVPSLYGLSHSNYLIFYNGGGCFSAFGNKRDRNGQHISCCSHVECIHEIGHVLGVDHEQSNPLRDDYIRIEWSNVGPWVWYRRSSIVGALTYGYYDSSSAMHYYNGGFNVNHQNTYYSLDKSLDFLRSREYRNFYLFKQVHETYNCIDYVCPPAQRPVCQNEGYATMQDGVCTCVCPQGLDPKSNCTTAQLTDNSLQALTWPEGQFTLLKSVDGCPDGFEQGHWYHKPAAGLWVSDPYHTVPLNKNWITHEFCTKTNPSAGPNAIKWPMGDYCILRKGGACPAGFDTGFIQMDDLPDDYANKTSGVLPDGVFGENTKFEFCCRNDVENGVPSKFPTTKPFILFRKLRSGCQEVEGMTSTHEYFGWKDDVAENISAIEGSVPYFYRSGVSYNHYFCYYEPINKDCSALYELTTENPRLTISSPNYPDGYPKNIECSYTVKAPEGTKIKIDIIDFNIPCKYPTHSLEIDRNMIGQHGKKYCGTGFEQTIVSSGNYARLILRSKEGSGDFKFQANLKLISELCYTNGGKDVSYDGTVNYTIKGDACLPWNEVKKCRFHKFRPETFDYDLTNSFCRNAVLGTDPWCYTNAETCARDYCDVCLIMRCYDLFSDCAVLMKDPNYCNNNKDGNAHKGCRKSCGLCPTQEAKTVSEVTCPPPEVVDSINPFPQKTQYQLGDQVEYVCPNDGARRNRTCTSSGRWTHLGFVCGACPNGWGYVDGRCYKWYDVRNTFDEAQDLCDGTIPKSSLPTVLTMNQSEYIMTIYMFDKEETGNIWIGLSDREVQGQFQWLDDTDSSSPSFWTNWDTDEPKDTGNCVMMAGSQKWQTASCTDKKSVVCQFKPLARTTCGDQIRNCDDVIRANPDVCVRQPDFAIANCPRSCAYCTDESTTIPGTCSFPGLPQHTVLTHPSQGGDITSAQFYEFVCDKGYLYQSGDFQRACLLSSELTGKPLVCVEPSLVEKPVNGEDIRSRDGNFGSAGYIYSSLNPDFHIRDAGKLTKWRFYSTYSGKIALQVWRNLTLTSGVFVGQNIIDNTGDNRIVTLEVPEAEQITVQVNDRIAIHFPKSGQTRLSYTGCDVNYQPIKGEQIISAQSLVPVNLVPGSSYEFNGNTAACKTWSLNAWVK